MKRVTISAAGLIAAAAALVTIAQGREAWESLRPWAPRAEVAALERRLQGLEAEFVRRLELEQAVDGLRAELAGPARLVWQQEIERLEFRKSVAARDLAECLERCWSEQRELRALERELAAAERALERYRP